MECITRLQPDANNFNKIFAVSLSLSVFPMQAFYLTLNHLPFCTVFPALVQDQTTSYMYHFGCIWNLDTRWFPTRAFSIRIWRIGYYHILCCQNANSTPSCHGVWSLIRWMQRPNRMANFLTKQIDSPKTNRQIDSNRESECSTSYLVASLFLLAADISERWRCTSLLSEYFYSAIWTYNFEFFLHRPNWHRVGVASVLTILQASKFLQFFLKCINVWYIICR